jgi:hypothetical protein
MVGSLFVFSRFVRANSGRRYAEVVTVFADGLVTAQTVLEADLREKTSRRPKDLPPPEVDAAYVVGPEWKIDEIPLDQPRILTFVVNEG